MKRSTTLAAAIFAGVAALSGCASNQQPQQIGYISNDSSTYGTIDSIQIMQAQRSSGVGAVTGGLIGGLLGNQVGGGSGRAVATVAGAVGGAVAGNAIQNSRNPNVRETYRVSVQLDNGAPRAFDVPATGDLRIGDRVRIDNGQISRM